MGQSQTPGQSKETLDRQRLKPAPDTLGDDRNGVVAMSTMDVETQVPLKGFVGEVIGKLGGLVVEVEQCTDRRGIVRVDPARIVEAACAMYAVPGARLATCTGIDVRDGIDVLYHWAIEPPVGDCEAPARGAGEGVVITIKGLAARPALEIDSIANDIPAANWIEREMHDLLGANFRNHPDMRRLILDDSWPEGVYPLRKDFDQVTDRPPLPPDQSPPEVDAAGGES